jgi:integration host factor subunit beta
MVAPLGDCCRSELCNHSHMTRSELINRLAVHFPMLVAQGAAKLVTLILDAIARVLARGSRVEIREFGSLVATHRPPRIGRNPKSGELVRIPAKQVLRFKAGKELRSRVDWPPFTCSNRDLP